MEYVVQCYERPSRPNVITSYSIHYTKLYEHLPENIKITQAITDVSVTQNTDKEKGFASTEWMLGIIILCLIIFGWIKVGFGKFIRITSYNVCYTKLLRRIINVIQSVAYDVDELINNLLNKTVATSFSLNVYFGQTPDKKYNSLAKKRNNFV